MWLRRLKNSARNWRRKRCGDLRGLEEREIPVSVAGAYEAVAAGVADGAVGGRGEGVGVEELRGLLGGAAAGVELAGEVGIDVGADGIAAVAGAGGVVAELRARRGSRSRG